MVSKKSKRHLGSEYKEYQTYKEMDRLWRAFDEVYRSVASRLGLSSGVFEVLLAIYQLGEGCLQKDICTNACLGKQTVNSSVHKLVKEGILRLEPAEVGRGMLIFLTEEGKRLIKERIEPMAQADVLAFSSLPREDQLAVIRIEREYLTRLRSHMAHVEKQLSSSIPEMKKH